MAAVYSPLLIDCWRGSGSRLSLIMGYPMPGRFVAMQPAQHQEGSERKKNNVPYTVIQVGLLMRSSAFKSIKLVSRHLLEGAGKCCSNGMGMKGGGPLSSAKSGGVILD